MKRRFFHFFLLLCFLGPLCAAAQETRNSDEGEALPTVVYLSLPASISAVLENPERAEQLFQTYTYPRNVLLYQLEKEIEKESAKAGKEEASKALLSRKRQNLIAKVEYLYLKANTDRRLMRSFLLLNGLTGDLPARADDNVYEILALDTGQASGSRNIPPSSGSSAQKQHNHQASDPDSAESGERTL